MKMVVNLFILITKDQERCQYDHLPCPRLCLGQPQSYHGGLIYHHLVLLVLHWQLLSRMQDWDWKMHSWIKILMMKWFDSYVLPVANGVLLTQDCKECEELAYGLWIFLSSFVLCQLKRIKIYHKIKDEPKIDQFTHNFKQKYESWIRKYLPIRLADGVVEKSLLRSTALEYILSTWLWISVVLRPYQSKIISIHKEYSLKFWYLSK